MDPGWLEMVRERSQFVFLQLWQWADWELNIRPLLSLVLGHACAEETDRSAHFARRRWSVGITGLAVALVSGVIGPLAILLQGQAWRWLWVPDLVGLLLVVPTVLHLWRSGPCGPLCAACCCSWAGCLSDRRCLLRRGLAVSLGRPQACAGERRSLLAAHCARDGRIGHRMGPHPRLAGPVVPTCRKRDGKQTLIFRAASWAWMACPSFSRSSFTRVPLRSRSIAVSGAIALVLGTVTVLAAPGALEDHRAEGTTAQIAEFADGVTSFLRGANVFVANRYYSAGLYLVHVAAPELPHGRSVFRA